jgi:putative nucleotidyltransferase with HDIG domain
MESTVERQSQEAATLPWAHLRIPPFPQIALRVLQLANDTEVSMLQLSQMICADPAFSSEVLTIANSPLYARRAPVTSILQAIGLLGTRNLRGLCLTVGMRAYLGESLNHDALRAIWRHSLACAFVAEQIALTNAIDSNTAYTAGVMHDIGRQALAIVRPKEYVDLLKKQQGPPASILRQERDLFGLDHCELGSQLITEWKLPSEFKAIAADHHSRKQCTPGWTLSSLINVSCRIADAVGFAAFPGCDVTPYSDLLEEMPSKECKLMPANVDELAFEIASKINSIEST